jgi:hypothetical protein
MCRRRPGRRPYNHPPAAPEAARATDDRLFRLAGGTVAAAGTSQAVREILGAGTRGFQAVRKRAVEVSAGAVTENPAPEDPRRSPPTNAPPARTAPPPPATSSDTSTLPASTMKL